jgi:DNA-binding XRE family transcriptional regulator
MSIIAKIAERKQKEDKHHGALSATLAIFQMDPNAREDLITYMAALNEAQKAGDEDEQEYLGNAILEVIEFNGDEDDSDLDAWEKSTTDTAEGRKAKEELQVETDNFFNAYQHYKANCGLTTIRAVADAAGLSPTTVQAIEKQRVKPQFKTITALAKAFGVRPEELNRR